MNLRQTAEIAAIVATSAAHVIESPRPIPVESLHGYWKQSRTRLKCWFAALQSLLHHGTARDDVLVAPQQEQLVGLCREVLATEMLTRVWSTVLLAADKCRCSDQAGAAVDSVFRGHQEARSEVLALLADDRSLPSTDQISLDRFRRRIERWTDALIGPLLRAYGVSDFAFDIRRAEDFAESSLQETLQGASAAYAPLLLAGVKAAIPKTCDADRERAMLNIAIIRAILAAFPPEAFGGDGRLKSARNGRLERSSRHPERPIIRNEQTARSGQRGAGGLSFVELRRNERRSEDRPD